MTSIKIRPQSTSLTPFIKSIAYSETDLPLALERKMPSAGVCLMLNLHEDEYRTYQGPDLSDVKRTSGAILSGPHTRATVIDTAAMRSNVSVTFETGGALPFLGVPMSDLWNELVPLDALGARFNSSFRDRVLEAQSPMEKLRVVESVLLEVFDDARMGQSVVFAASALAIGTSVSAVTEGAGMLPKPFVARFRHQVGITPKLWSRVHRLQRLLSSVRLQSAIDWSAAAVEHGFYDQAHLINDFRQLTGITPTAYQPRSVDAHNHVLIGP